MKRRAIREFTMICNRRARVKNHNKNNTYSKISTFLIFRYFDWFYHKLLYYSFFYYLKNGREFRIFNLFVCLWYTITFRSSKHQTRYFLFYLLLKWVASVLKRKIYHIVCINLIATSFLKFHRKKRHCSVYYSI